MEITTEILDRLIATSKKNREKTKEGPPSVWLTKEERLREFDHMIELETQFKAALGA